MKQFIFFILSIWLSIVNVAWADVPKAEIGIQPLNQELPFNLNLTITIPENHHAYLDEGTEKLYLPIVIDSNHALRDLGLSLTYINQPVGEFDNAVKARVLRGQEQYQLQLNAKQALANNKLNLAVRYQICNDLTHVCFRPQTTQVAFALPVAENDLNLTDKLLALFKANQHNSFILFGLMFIAGLLSTATPCVYPMLPITSMFIIDRAGGSAVKEKQHALAYLLGIIGTYTVLGLVAGMTGGAFNSFMQSAWVNLAFALFFTFFALALLGFYQLSFMQSEVHNLDQHSARVKGLTGTWLMGTVAGLVISPCVGPIVFALLLQTADTIAEQTNALAQLNQTLSAGQKLLIAGQGSVMMAGFGLGVGLPFFILSVVKLKLPRAGYWMDKVKLGFGLMILYFAYSYFAKAMGVWAISPQITFTLALGLVLVWIAIIYFDVLTALHENAQANQKMHRYCGVISLLIGVWLMFNSFQHIPLFNTAQATSLTQKASCETENNTQQSALVEQEAGIEWHRQYQSALIQAKKTNKPIFIDFYASWCANCVAFKQETANNSELNKVLREKAIALKLVDQEDDFEKFKANPEHRSLKIGLPYFAILSPDGRMLWSTTDYTAVDKIITVLNTSDSV